MDLWQRKLLAFLHDPPHKPFGVAGHEGQRLTPLTSLGLTLDEMRLEFDRLDDHWAAAADRLIFPHPATSGVRTDWRDSGLEFRHPLAGTGWKPSVLPTTANVAEEMVNAALHGVGTDAADWSTKYLRLWRLWPEVCARRKLDVLAYLVADTRIPDHTLWQHNALVSAFSNCESESDIAFLLFQIGPVQDFIKQARKTQDLWAGSFLLSYLIAQAMLAVADEIGPDAIVYPQLRCVPLADWHWWKRGILGAGEKLRASHENELLTPNLPNRFLALIPAGWRRESDGKSLPEVAEGAVRAAWDKIAKSVRDEIQQRVGKDFSSEGRRWDIFWEEQVKRFPVVDYVAHRWADTESVLRLAASDTPPLHDSWTNHPLHHAELWARNFIPPEHRDARCYKHRSWKETGQWKSELMDAAGQPLGRNQDPVFDNPGLAWALHYAATDWKFAAVKNARGFAAWTPTAGNAPASHAVPKDPLDGRNEVLGGPTNGGDDEKDPNNQFWKAMREAKWGVMNKNEVFKGKQKYGAISVIKRLFPHVWFQQELDCQPPHFDSVIDIARAIDREEDDPSAEKEPKYYAIIAMDGDDMGQWVSGVKAPALMKLLAGDEADEKSPKGYFKKHWNASGAADLPAGAEVKRVLTPGYHAALSEALGNFSLYCAGQIVEGNRGPDGRMHGGFGGQILYAGGDDVLAMVPAEKALDCAQALQLIFRGVTPDDPEAFASTEVKRVLNGLFEFPAPGFVKCRHATGEGEHLRPNWPLMVMGPCATASVGIAIGHVRSPMQDTIQAARDAEAAAKQVPGKSAFCLSVLKRSGEAAQFSARWASGVVGVWAELTAGVFDQSSRFAYRYLQLIRPLLGSVSQGNDGGWEKLWTSDLKSAVEAELRHVLRQQAKQSAADAASNAGRWIDALVGADLPTPALSPRHFVHFWMAWAFLNRVDD